MPQFDDSSSDLSAAASTPATSPERSDNHMGVKRKHHNDPHDDDGHETQNSESTDRYDNKRIKTVETSKEWADTMRMRSVYGNDRYRSAVNQTVRKRKSVDTAHYARESKKQKTDEVSPPIVCRNVPALKTVVESSPRHVHHSAESIPQPAFMAAIRRVVRRREKPEKPKVFKPAKREPYSFFLQPHLLPLTKLVQPTPVDDDNDIDAPIRVPIKKVKGCYTPDGQFQAYRKPESKPEPESYRRPGSLRIRAPGAWKKSLKSGVEEVKTPSKTVVKTPSKTVVKTPSKTVVKAAPTQSFVRDVRRDEKGKIVLRKNAWFVEQIMHNQQRSWEERQKERAAEGSPA